MFFYYQNLFWEPKLAGDELLWVEPEPIFFYLEPELQKNIWSRSREKMAQLRNTLHT